VIPAPVDIHFHGAMGEDFSDATAEGLQNIA
jgi:N-acetylglucosamine-6-phosphate deacetylase